MLFESGARRWRCWAKFTFASGLPWRYWASASRTAAHIFGLRSYRPSEHPLYRDACQAITISQYLPRSPYISPYALPRRVPGHHHLSLHLPTSPYISLYLRTSPYISLSLCRDACQVISAAMPEPEVYASSGAPGGGGGATRVHEVRASNVRASRTSARASCTNPEVASRLSAAGYVPATRTSQAEGGEPWSSPGGRLVTTQDGARACRL